MVMFLRKICDEVIDKIIPDKIQTWFKTRKCIYFNQFHGMYGKMVNMKKCHRRVAVECVSVLKANKILIPFKC